MTEPTNQPTLAPISIVDELRSLLPDMAWAIESVKREGVDSFGEYAVYQEESTIYVGSMPRAVGKTPAEAVEHLRKSISDWRICQK